MPKGLDGLQRILFFLFLLLSSLSLSLFLIRFSEFSHIPKFNIEPCGINGLDLTRCKIGSKNEHLSLCKQKGRLPCYVAAEVKLLINGVGTMRQGGFILLDL